ncbi:TetR/AcrR family transcriptional regulator C-terminal domain-containing protein [Spiractinospora alimapuensis]|uniref:TetR/AcrR family transcriptional regulator C-terminal domain-containing protein n=1 Tax=Spiractinospora alimapuensis TaxID=2820884 RepID=UPI001F380D72|nr:TetR/AcrR family transcriptional regulator C-terminal domain-containing protein [Spiractinospora alimapuensis]QVQ53972.1 TetR/AcrR family transcriptional regulator C-terminal domain-containing protein [Spiractinospora alimapuensis]
MSERRTADLNRDRITTTALRFLDEVGLEGMTMRRLASELDVKPPALYWHFRDKRQLLDHMADTIVRSAGMGPPQEGEPWQDWLLRRGREYRAALLRHRDGARVVSTAHTLTPDTLTRFDEELAALVAAGFSPSSALRTITVLSQFVTGHVLQEQAERPEDSAARALERQSPDDPLATLAAALRDSGGTAGKNAFEHGLRVLVAGTAAVVDVA